MKRVPGILVLLYYQPDGEEMWMDGLRQHKKSTGAVLQSHIKPLNANKPTPRYYTFVSFFQSGFCLCVINRMFNPCKTELVTWVKCKFINWALYTAVHSGLSSSLVECDNHHYRPHHCHYNCP